MKCDKVPGGFFSSAAVPIQDPRLPKDILERIEQLSDDETFARLRLVGGFRHLAGAKELAYRIHRATSAYDDAGPPLPSTLPALDAVYTETRQITTSMARLAQKQSSSFDASLRPTKLSKRALKRQIATFAARCANTQSCDSNGILFTLSGPRWSFQGRFMATLPGYEQPLHIHDFAAATPEESVFICPEVFGNWTFLNHSNNIVYWNKDNSYSLCNLEKKPLAPLKFTEASENFSSFRQSPDGKYFAITYESRTIAPHNTVLFDMSHHEPQQLFFPGREAVVGVIRFSNDWKLVYTPHLDDGHPAALWRLDGSPQLLTYGPENSRPNLGIRFSKNGEYLVSYVQDSPICYKVNDQSLTPLAIPSQFSGETYNIEFSQHEGYIQIHNWAMGDWIYNIEEGTSSLKEMFQFNDGRTHYAVQKISLSFTSSDLRVWDPERNPDHFEQYVLDGSHFEFVTAHHFAPSGYLLMYSKSHAVRLINLNIPSSAAVNPFPKSIKIRAFDQCCVARDSSWLMCQTVQNDLALVTLQPAPRFVARIPGGPERIQRIDSSVDSRFVVVISEYGTCRFIDLQKHLDRAETS